MWESVGVGGSVTNLEEEGLSFVRTDVIQRGSCPGNRHQSPFDTVVFSVALSLSHHNFTHVYFQMPLGHETHCETNILIGFNDVSIWLERPDLAMPGQFEFPNFPTAHCTNVASHFG